MYRCGEGAPRDLEKAALWAGKAAEQDHTKAQVSLAMLLLNGDAIPKGRERAAYWLERATNQGHKQAKGMLERLRSHTLVADLIGDGIDVTQAPHNHNGFGFGNEKWGRSALETDNKNMDNDILPGQKDEFYRQAWKTMPRDIAAGMFRLLRLAKSGYGKAERDLTGLYDAGDGEKPDRAKVRDWARKFAEREVAVTPELSRKAEIMYLSIPGNWKDHLKESIGIDPNLSGEAFWAEALKLPEMLEMINNLGIDPSLPIGQHRAELKRLQKEDSGRFITEMVRLGDKDINLLRASRKNDGDLLRKRNRFVLS